MAAARRASFCPICCIFGGIDSVVLERQSKAYVLKRIRAGVLEDGTVKLLRDAGLGQRMDREGHAHDGSWIVWQDREPFLINTKAHYGKPMVSHGQTAITEELYRVRERDGGSIVDEAENVRSHDLTAPTPKVAYEKDGVDPNARLRLHRRLRRVSWRLAAEYSLEPAMRTFERAYPFGWLGVMSETPPVGEVIYARHARGFALASLRNPTLSRYYIQCGLDTDIADWPDERFWDELKRRFPPEIADKIVTGPVDRKVNRPLAKLRRGTDAIRPPLSCRRRRAYRAADRSEGPQSGDFRRLLSPARSDRAFPQRR